MKTAMLTAAITTLAASSMSSAAVLAQWDYNSTSTSVLGAPSAGSGNATAVNFGVTTTAIFTSKASAGQGSVNDPVATPASNNRAATFDTLGVAVGDSGKRGPSFFTSTHNKTDLVLSFELVARRQASRYWQIIVTANSGATWAPVPTGTASATSASSNSTTALISNTGLIDVISDGPSTSTAINAIMPTSFSSFTYAFPSGSSYEGKLGFGFAIVPVVDSTTGAFVSSSASFAGGSAYATGLATARLNLDMVTISGIPEPTSFLAVTAIAAAGLARRSRR